MTDYYTRVIVHAVIPAEDAGDALSILCERIREGIGTDDGDREHKIAIAAGAASREDQPVEIMQVNEEFVKRLRGLI